MDKDSNEVTSPNKEHMVVKSNGSVNKIAAHDVGLKRNLDAVFDEECQLIGETSKTHKVGADVHTNPIRFVSVKKEKI